MNRQQQPPIRPMERIDIPSMKKKLFPNGIPYYVIHAGDQEIVRVDIIINAGSWDQEKMLASRMTCRMLKEGTAQLSSAEISEAIDYYGASVQVSSSFHSSYVTLYTLTKYMEPLMALIEQLLKEPSFPQKELDTVLSIYKQDYQLSQKKVMTLASKGFSETLFGKEHGYGRTATLEDYDRLLREDLIDFHRRFIHSGNCQIVMAGNVTEHEIKLVEKHLGASPWGSLLIKEEKTFVAVPAQERQLLIEKEDALQSAVRLGTFCVKGDHPDFHKMKFLNMILGGYFGSRLMSSIREEKGYTYGIGSSICSLKNAAYLQITTQTDCKYTRPLIEEVYRQIELLQQELVGPEELERVRNYSIGQFCRSLESPFAIADAYISLLVNQSDTSTLFRLLDSIQTTTAEEIRDLAVRALSKEQFYEVVAGKMQ